MSQGARAKDEYVLLLLEKKVVPGLKIILYNLYYHWGEMWACLSCQYTCEAALKLAEWKTVYSEQGISRQALLSTTFC